YEVSYPDSCNDIARQRRSPALNNIQRSDNSALQPMARNQNCYMTKRPGKNQTSWLTDASESDDVSSVTLKPPIPAMGSINSGARTSTARKEFSAEMLAAEYQELLLPLLEDLFASSAPVTEQHGRLRKVKK